MDIIINKNYFKQTIFSDNSDIRMLFQKNFGKEINEFIDVLFSAYEDYKILDKHSLEDMQKMWVTAKEKEYLKEINHMTKAAHLLRNIIFGIKAQLEIVN